MNGERVIIYQRMEDCERYETERREEKEGADGVSGNRGLKIFIFKQLFDTCHQSICLMVLFCQAYIHNT